MWEQGLNFGNGGFQDSGFGGGGFYDSTQGGAPGTPSGGEKRRQRAQNLVPVMITDILDCREEPMRICDMEVGMVALVGKVERVDHQATKSIFGLNDGTGQIDCMQWKDENSSLAEDIEEGSFVRVVGSIRSQQEKKHVMLFKIVKTSCDEEIDAHPLEVASARLKIRKMNDKENSRIGANSFSGGATGGIGYGATQMSTSFAGSGASSALIPGLSSQQDIVYRMLRSCLQEEGLSRDDLFRQVNSKMSRSDMDNALEYLSNEGHIYSTTDDNHFKSTDG